MPRSTHVFHSRIHIHLTSRVLLRRKLQRTRAGRPRVSQIRRKLNIGESSDADAMILVVGHCAN